jgi:hypothetical protein
MSRKFLQVQLAKTIKRYDETVSHEDREDSELPLLQRASSLATSEIGY